MYGKDVKTYCPCLRCRKYATDLQYYLSFVFSLPYFLIIHFLYRTDYFSFFSLSTFSFSTSLHINLYNNLYKTLNQTFPKLMFIGPRNKFFFLMNASFSISFLVFISFSHVISSLNNCSTSSPPTVISFPAISVDFVFFALSFTAPSGRCSVVECWRLSIREVVGDHLTEIFSGFSPQLHQSNVNMVPST